MGTAHHQLSVITHSAHTLHHNLITSQLTNFTLIFNKNGFDQEQDTAEGI